MCKIISVINHKGGVGKTTTTVNLGASLSRKGKKVLLVDFDPQANLTQNFLGVVPEIMNEDGSIKTVANVVLKDEEIAYVKINDNLDIIPGDLELSTAERIYANQIGTFTILKNKLEDVDGYDYILIDCPPSLGFFTINALNASTHILICTEAATMSVRGMQTIFETIKEVQRAGKKHLNIVGILASNFKPLKVQKVVLNHLREEYSDLMFNVFIRSYKIYAEASAYGKPVFDMKNENAEKAQEDFIALANEIDKRIGGVE